MTPAQLTALADVHRRVHDETGRGAGGPAKAKAQPGNLSDLLAMQRMKVM